MEFSSMETNTDHSVHTRMEEANLQPDVSTFTALITTLASAGTVHDQPSSTYISAHHFLRK